MSNETKEGSGRNWTNTLLFLILMAIIAVGLGVWEARHAAKSHPVKEEKAKDNMPNAAVVPCPCPTPKPVVKKPSKKKTAIHKTATQPPKPAVVPVAVVPVVEKTTKKELLADVDPDFNRTKFVPDEEPQKVVVVNRTVDISTPVRSHSHHPWSYWGTTYSNGPYGADTQRIVGGQTYSPATPVITPPPGHTGGNGNGTVVTPPPGHSGM